MRMLIYGFGPYGRFRDNITEKIVRALAPQSGLKKIVFPVRFVKGQFIGAVKKFRPDLILGLGQCSRGRVLRIETTAVNRRRSTRDDKPKPILPSGAPKLFTSLKLNLGSHARSSRDAGDYVCNFSMYIILEFIERRRLPIHYGFVHVPRVYDPGKAGRILRRTLSSAVLKACPELDERAQRRKLPISSG